MQAQQALQTVKEIAIEENTSRIYLVGGEHGQPPDIQLEKLLDAVERY